MGAQLLILSLVIAPVPPRSGVGVHLDEIGGLSLDDATALAQALGDAIERRLGVRPVLDDPLWPACQADDRCVSAIRDRTRAENVVLLKVFGAPTKIRMIAECVRPADPSLRVEIDVARAESAWSPALEDAATRLFPGASPGESPLTSLDVSAHPGAHERAPGLLLPLSALGASAALFGVGAVFGISSLRARDAIETEPLSDEVYEDELGRMRSHGRVANILFGSAAVALAASIVLFIAGD